MPIPIVLILGAGVAGLAAGYGFYRRKTKDRREEARRKREELAALAGELERRQEYLIFRINRLSDPSLVRYERFSIKDHSEDFLREADQKLVNFKLLIERAEWAERLDRQEKLWLERMSQLKKSHLIHYDELPARPPTYAVLFHKEQSLIKLGDLISIAESFEKLDGRECSLIEKRDNLKYLHYFTYSYTPISSVILDKDLLQRRRALLDEFALAIEVAKSFEELEREQNILLDRRDHLNHPHWITVKPFIIDSLDSPKLQEARDQIRRLEGEVTRLERLEELQAAEAGLIEDIRKLVNPGTFAYQRVSVTAPTSETIAELVLISTLFGLVFPDYFGLPIGLSDCFDRAGH
jgi:hypothetical protein